MARKSRSKVTKVLQRRHILRAHIQLQIHSRTIDKNTTDLETFCIDCLKTSDKLLRSIWSVIGICCFLICTYQIYDRIAYYVSIPIRTDVSVSTDPITMPPFVLSNVYTEKLKPYLNTTINHDDRCTDILMHSALVSTLPRLNFTEIWLASNLTPNIDRIRIMENTGSHITVTPNTGSGLNSSIIQLKEKFTPHGLATVIKLKEKLKIGTNLRLELHGSGNCKYPSLVFSTEDVTPYNNFFQIPLEQTMTMTYAINRYDFLNTHKSPCESNFDERKRCYRECIKARSKHVRCWFPFMPRDSTKPDCSEMRNSTNVMEKFLKCYFIISGTSPTQHCSCLKPCTETNLYLRLDSTHRFGTNNFTLIYTSREPTITETHEKHAYDVISLFVDMGGTLGLFLGLSVLSIFQLLHTTVFRSRKKYEHKRVELGASIVKKLLTQLKKDVGTKDDPKTIRYIRNAFTVLLTFIATTLIYLEILRYTTEPVQMLVGFKESDSVQIPDLIACGQSYKIAKIKDIITNENATIECQLNLLDLIDVLNTTNLHKSVTESLWESQELRFQYVNGPIVNESLIRMHTGSCLKLSFCKSKSTIYGQRPRTLYSPTCILAPIQFAGSGTAGAVFGFRTFGKAECLENLFQLYVVPPQTYYHSTIFHQLPVMSGSNSAMSVEASILQRHGTKLRPCGTLDALSRCKFKCYDDKMQNRIKCRLPFMENINKSYCDTTRAAKESLTTYLSIIKQSYVQNECNCVWSCTELMHKIHWSYSEVMTHTSFMVLTCINIQHLIDSVTEIPAYSLVSLFCMVGNILGITLGVSVLSFLHLTLSNFKCARK